MKNIFIRIVALITMSILLISNILVFATENDRHPKVDKIREEVFKGEISKINPNTIVIGEKSGKVIFRVSKNTIIKDENQNKVELSDLEAGMSVEISYNKRYNIRVFKSFEAISIQVVNNSSEIKNVVVQDISIEANNRLLLNVFYEAIDKNSKPIENTFSLVVDNNTDIINQFGVKATKSELKVNMVLDVVYSEEASNNYAQHINIVKQFKDSKTIEANIIEKYIDNSVKYVLIGNSEKASEQILLVLSDKTLLKDQDGKDIGYAQLEVGQKVKAEYSLAMTRSLPAQAQVYSIQTIDEKVIPNIINNINVISSIKSPLDKENKCIYELLDNLFEELGIVKWEAYIKDKDIDWDIDDYDDLIDLIEQISKLVLGDDYDDDMEDKIEDLLEQLFKDVKGQFKDCIEKSNKEIKGQNKRFDNKRK